MALTIEKIKKLPDTPGVYFFLGKNKKILYIGKATSLRDRVRSYFGKDLIKTRGQLLVNMMLEAKTIDFKQTDSVLEALILEADLIRKFKPEFNTKEKDDKSFYCVAITKEDFPVVKLVRKKDANFETLEVNGEKMRSLFGPFTNGSQLKEALMIIRKIFPYRDEKCPGTIAKRPCFNYTIGLCPGVCAGVVGKKDYARTIRNIELFFQGKKKKLLAMLEKEMKQAVAGEAFERAGEIRNQIFALEHIRDTSLIKKDILVHGGPGSTPFLRIESYDIAHLSGENMVGVMTVLEDGEHKKSDYRKFNIRGFDKSNDIGALREVVTRRLAHSEWPMPNLVVVDGGETQRKAIAELFRDIPVLSVVKDERHKAREVLGDAELVQKYKNEAIKINADTHRFAITFHRQKRAKNFLK